MNETFTFVTAKDLLDYLTGLALDHDLDAVYVRNLRDGEDGTFTENHVPLSDGSSVVDLVVGR